MRKILIGGAMVSVLIVVLLIYNRKQLPTFEDVIKFTENWSIPTEEVKMLVFYVRSDDELVMPVNIRGFNKNGELIYSTIKQTKKVALGLITISRR